jgi:hypothetical protein
MLEKLTMHDIQDVTEFFNMANKCARAAEGRAWHTPPALEAGKGGKHDASATTQGGSSKNKNKNNNKKRVGGNKHPLTGAPTVAAAAVAMGGG